SEDRPAGAAGLRRRGPFPRRALRARRVRGRRRVMPPAVRAAVPALALFAACQSYSPDPGDAAARARAFAARLPEAAEIRAFAESLHGGPAAARGFDPSDGVDRAEARLVALLLNADLRVARRRAGVFEASAREAGRLRDPELSVDVE